MFKRLLQNPFALAALYYLIFFICYYLALFFIVVQYSETDPFFSNVSALLLFLSPPFVSAVLLGLSYAAVVKTYLPLKKRLQTALLATIPPLGLIGLIAIFELFSDDGFSLDVFEWAVIYAILAYTAAVFLSILLIAGLVGRLIARGPQ